MTKFEKELLLQLRGTRFGKIYCYFMETYRPGHKDFESRLDDFCFIFYQIKKGTVMAKIMAAHFPPTEYKIFGLRLFSGSARYESVRSLLFPPIKANDGFSAADDMLKSDFKVFWDIIEKLAQEESDLALRLRSTVKFIEETQKKLLLLPRENRGSEGNRYIRNDQL